MSSSSSSTNPRRNPIIKRGSHESAPFSRGLFVLLRALDLPLQYEILAGMLGGSIIKALNGTLRTAGPPLAFGGASLGLSPYRTILFSMAVGAFVKQTYWVLMVSHEAITPIGSVMVGAVNTIYNSMNSLLFICTATSVLTTPSEELALSAPLVVGTGLFVLGVFLEWVSEVQRKEFKDDPKNEGKLFTGGLFALSRHINYGGYTLWRAGFALASAGWIWGAISAAWFTYDFTKRGVPEMDEYCTNRVSDLYHPFVALVDVG